MEFHESRTYSAPVSGQAEILDHHDRWIMAYGITTQMELASHHIFNHRLVGHEVEHIVLPTQLQIRDTREGFIELRQVIFPGYFFLGVNTECPTWWELEESVPELLNFLYNTRIVKEEGKKKEKKDIVFLTPREKVHIVEMIQEIPRHTIVKRFAIGNRVRVMSGSFANLYGCVAELDAKKRRAKVNLQVERSMFPTWIPLFDLEVRDG
jgi:transcription antitermination factor NusG